MARGGVARGRWRRGSIAVLAGVVGAAVLAVAPASSTPSFSVGPGSVAAGVGHACALAAGGTVKCWGFNNAGQLGNGHSAGGQIVTKPVNVVGISGATAVAAGNFYSCALLAAGTVKCWGQNALGQLGNGTETDSNKPVSVKGVKGGGLLSGVIALTAGGSTTCALLAAGAGTVKCWGFNSHGSLGNGSGKYQRATTPQSVAGLTRVVAISTNGGDTCAVLKAGALKCWGFNEYGELGPSLPYGPDDCFDGDFDIGCATTPMTVKGISNVIATTANQCAVVKNGRAVCWNDKGFSTVPGLSGATAISAPADASYYGDGEYSCALLVGRTAKCWGSNNQGQLGNGTTKSATVATNVSGLTGVTAISAGGDFACARLAAGAVYCWGGNGYGQLGNGGAPSAAKPVKVSGS